MEEDLLWKTKSQRRLPLIKLFFCTKTIFHWEIRGNTKGNLKCGSALPSLFYWSVKTKRKSGDDGEWWLPSQWRSSTRARWPSSASTSRRRRGGWSATTDPERADSLLMEKDKHKLLWKDIRLTCEGRVDGYEHLEDGGGGDEQRGEPHGAEGHTPRDYGVVRPSVQPGGGGLKEFVRQNVHLQSGSEEAADPVLPGDDVQLVRGGGEQSPVAHKKRRYFRKLRGGVSRNGYLQTNILNFTVPKLQYCTHGVQLVI